MFVERGYGICRGVVSARVVEGADDGRIAAGEDASDASALSAVCAWWGKFNEDLIALHGAVDFVGRDEDVFFSGRGSGVWSDEAEAIAMDVEAAGEQVVLRVFGGDGPVIAVGFGQFAASREAVELFEEQAAFAAAAQAQFTHELFVSGGSARSAIDTPEELVVGHVWHR